MRFKHRRENTLRSIVRLNVFHGLERPVEASPGLLDNRRHSLSTSIICRRHHRQSTGNSNPCFSPTNIARSHNRLLVTLRRTSRGRRGKIGPEPTHRGPSIQTRNFIANLSPSRSIQQYSHPNTTVRLSWASLGVNSTPSFFQSEHGAPTSNRRSVPKTTCARYEASGTDKIHLYFPWTSPPTPTII